LAWSSPLSLIAQNEGKDTIAQANLAITANTVNNQGGQLAAGGNLNITVDTLNNTQNDTQDTFLGFSGVLRIILRIVN
jgi:adhesin HecA-like repeat protein